MESYDSRVCQYCCDAHGGCGVLMLDDAQLGQARLCRLCDTRCLSQLCSAYNIIYTRTFIKFPWLFSCFLYNNIQIKQILIMILNESKWPVFVDSESSQQNRLHWLDVEQLQILKEELIDQTCHHRRHDKWLLAFAQKVKSICVGCTAAKRQTLVCFKFTSIPAKAGGPSPTVPEKEEAENDDDSGRNHEKRGKYAAWCSGPGE